MIEALRAVFWLDWTGMGWDYDWMVSRVPKIEGFG